MVLKNKVIQLPGNVNHVKQNETQLSGCSSPDSSFLRPDINYTVPHFSTNVLDNDLVLTLNVKNVDPASVAVAATKASLHVKFSSTTFSHFAIYLEFSTSEEHSLLSHSVEPWDNNVVLQLSLHNVPFDFAYGLDATSEVLKRSRLKGSVHGDSEPIQVAQEAEEEEEQLSYDDDIFGDCDSPPETLTTPPVVEKPIEVPKGAKESKVETTRTEKPTGKGKRKGRSLSESHCSTGTVQGEEGNNNKTAKTTNGVGVAPGVGAVTGNGNQRKSRSLSESCGDILTPDGSWFHFKSILKRRPLHSDSSSVDEHSGGSCSLGVSFEVSTACSIGDITEEDDYSDHPTGSCKKTVTFNDVIKKQVFRWVYFDCFILFLFSSIDYKLWVLFLSSADSSIVGRKNKNMKKRAKKRGDGRRFSESENSEGEDKSANRRSLARRDSGLDVSEGEDGQSLCEDSDYQQHATGKCHVGGENEEKSGMLFNIEL